MDKFKQSLAEKERARIANKGTESGFISRNAALNYLLLYLLYPIAAIYSAFTQGAALYVYLDRVINSAIGALVFTVVVALIIEVSKYFFGRALSDDIRAQVWTENAHHVTAFALKLIAFVAVFAFSITLSLTGAPDVAQDYRESTAPVTAQLISTDSIRAYYDDKIAQERADIAAAGRMTWKGNIVKDGREIIQTAKANISGYEAQKASALKDAQLANNEAQAAYNAETKRSGDWLTGFAGLGEALALIVLLFAGNYESGAEKEVFAGAGETTIQPPQVTGPMAPITPTITTGAIMEGERRPIGFYTDKGRYNGDNNGKTAKDTPTPDGARYPVGQCAHCGGDYLKTVWNKKYCSEDCKLEYHAQKHGGVKFNPNLKNRK